MQFLNQGLKQKSIYSTGANIIDQRFSTGVKLHVIMSRPQRCGFVSLLYSVGDKPLSLWSKHISLDGRIRRVEDHALRGDKVVEIMGPHQTPVPTNITCPTNPLDVLNIKLPILVLVVKNLELMFKLEFQLIDKAMHRRQFSLTTHNPEKPALPHASVVRVPLKLDDGWNNLEINLQTLCNEVYGSDYQALQRIIIYPNCRLRRVYFQDRHYEQDETPVELCQAFFDMYMLKWGIHLVERSCQTEETYTGPLQPCDLEYFATESNVSVSVTTTSLPLDQDIRINQIKQVMGKEIGVSMTLGNGMTVILKNNSKSVNQLGRQTEIIGNCESKVSKGKRSPSATNYDVRSTNLIDKQKSKPANLCEKDRKASEHRAKKNKVRNLVREKLTGPDSPEESLDFKDKRGMDKLFPHIEKSQYLKSQIGENFLDSNPKKDYEYGEGITANDQVENKAQSKVSDELDPRDKTALNLTDRSLISSNQECVQNSKAQIDVSIKKLKTHPHAANNLKKIETHQGDGLLSHSVRAIEEVINEVQKIREQLINYDIDSRIPSGITRDDLKALSYNVPPLVEIQAKSSEETSKKAVLSTDKAVCDFLELRHAVNKKILEKLKDKGLTITEVELSIYNSKNRRNCYGQGKLIESGKRGTNKASGLSSIEPVEMDVSLKKEQLSLNDKICMQLRNELDAALLQLKSTQVRVTTEVVEDAIGNIVKNGSKESSPDFFTGKEAQYIKRKVCNEKAVKRDAETGPCIEYMKKGEKQIHDFIKNLDKYSGSEIVNVLFRKQTYDTGDEYRSSQHSNDQS